MASTLTTTTMALFYLVLFRKLYPRFGKLIFCGIKNCLTFHFFSVNRYANVNQNPKSRVYVWGQACYGALGNPGINKWNFIQQIVIL